MITKKPKSIPSTKAPLTIPDNDDFSDISIIGRELSLLERAKVDYTKELPPPEAALKVRDEIFGTLGNFSLVIGKAKSRKTFLMALIMAACLGFAKKTKLFGNMHMMQGCLPPGKKRVVFVDTEQGEYHVAKVAKRVTRLTDPVGNSKLENFDVYGARTFATNERVQIIEDIIATTPDLGLLVIDGVRDIITSINDEEQATFMANKLLKWTEENQIHIITVLHQNKGDFNARGHIGTELINKAETTVSVTPQKGEDVSKVEIEYCRNKEFDPFAFRITDDGLPEVDDGWMPKSKEPKGKQSPVDIGELTHAKILQQIKTKIGDKPKHSDVLSLIKLTVTDQLQPIGNTIARDYFTYYMGENAIIKHGKDRSPKAYYTIHPEAFNA
ncbi:AAA family ATPase [Rhodohalobacter sp. 8-1]|uniref:AAA family ATPase n=1 Tax=Rhodohalobacter sp. 8-1 TaxID=3131972 RepID=UPI0030EC43E1